MATEQERARKFVEDLQRVLGSGLRAALIYGSAARGEYRKGASDINLLVIVDSLGPDRLRAVAGPTREWLADGNPPPLLMSEREWRNSADVFPVEYTDIRDAHIRLAGEDPFEGIRLSRSQLRHQLEHELRSKKIQLREGYIVAGESEEAMAKLIVLSLSTFLALFRGALRLAGERVPASTPELIGAAAARVGFDPAPMLEVYRTKQEVKPDKARIGHPLADAYLAAVEAAARWLDGFRAQEGVPDEV